MDEDNRRFDNSPTHLGSTYRLFQEALQAVVPEVFRTGCAYLLVDSVIEDLELEVRNPVYFEPTRNVVDEVEIYLISWFNYPFLLNRGIGGRDPQFLIPMEDEVLFHELQTQFFQFFQQHKEPRTPAMYQKFRYMYARIQEYAMENPALTNTGIYPPTDDLRDMMLARSTPYLIAKHTIIVYCAEDIPVQDYKNATPFLHSTCRTSVLTKKMMAQTEAWERGSQIVSTDMLQGSFLCHSELYPGLKSDALAPASVSSIVLIFE